MSDDSVQLDLTATIEEVPQANSLPLFIALLDAVHRGQHEVARLAEELEIEERTVHYYVDFGRWLKFVRTPERGKVELTETGNAFVDSVPGRGRLFSTAMFSQPLIQSVNTLKRESANDDDVETLDTREACYRAIKSMTDLSESTARRRASGLAHMLRAAYKTSHVDWTTGSRLPEYENVTFDFDGRTFLTAMAARAFAPEREYRIGFPRQVRHFVENEGRGISAKAWKRASYDSADGEATWFGSIPVNESTVHIAGRGGRDLRKLVIACAPYITLAVAILTYRDARRRPSVRLTHDMYGLRFWDHDRELGAPMDVIEALADALGLQTVIGLPRALSHAPEELTEPGVENDLLETLLAAGILVEKDTTFELNPSLEPELREGSDTSASIGERLESMQDELPALFRELGS